MPIGSAGIGTAGIGGAGIGGAGITKAYSVPYVGPLDLVPGVVVAYSLRAMTAGSTANAIRLRRSSDDAEQTFALVNNAVEVSAVAAFIGGGSGSGVTWFDQSGNARDAIQATGENQPTWLASTTNSKPGLGFDRGAEQAFATSESVTLPNGEYAVFAVYKKATNASPSAFVGIDQNVFFPQAWEVGFLNNTTVTLQAYKDPNFAGGDSTSTAGLDNTYAVLDGAWEFGSWSVRVNGAALTEGTDNDSGGAVGSISEKLGVGRADGNSPGAEFDGEIMEILVYPTLLSDADRSAIRENIAAYYGITLS